LAAGQYARALSAYQHARELNPTDGELQLGAMRARALLAAADPESLPRDAADLSYELDVLLEEDPAQAAGYLTAQAQLLGRAGKVELAKAKLDLAIKRDPSSPLAHTALGHWYARRDRLSEARREFEAALQRDAHSEGALVGLVHVKRRQGDDASAVSELRALIAEHDSYTARLELAECLVTAGKSDEALPLFSRALAQAPDDPSALFGAAKASEAVGKPAAAIEAYKRLLALPAPEGPDNQAALDRNQLAQRRLLALTATP